MPIWKKVLLEISLRAIKQVHHRHMPWALIKKDIRTDDLRLLNENEAIFTALETAVAAEISNEFIYSIYTRGMKIKDTDKDKEYSARNYEMSREVYFTYASENNGKSKTVENFIDLVTRRYDGDGWKIPQLIELKRWTKMDVDINSGKVDENNNSAEVKKDVEKLQNLYRNWGNLKHQKGENNRYLISENKDQKPLLYILTWGKYPVKNVATPEGIADYIKTTLGNDNIMEDEKGPGNKAIYLKWLPLEFANDSSETPKVKTWLWLALIEIQLSKHETI